jgi:hypothetical protein
MLCREPVSGNNYITFKRSQSASLPYVGIEEWSTKRAVKYLNQQL